jgi:hypothetical protein
MKRPPLCWTREAQCIEQAAAARKAAVSDLQRVRNLGKCLLPELGVRDLACPIKEGGAFDLYVR